MKTTYTFKKHFKTIVIAFSMLAMVLTAAFVLPGPVEAASEAQVPQGTPQAAGGNTALVKAFQAEQAFLARQAANLENTANIVTKVQDLITQANAKNLDTSALEAALTAFQGRISEAHSAHDTAAGILGAHAGFNEDGSVSNPTEARQTVLDGGKALKSAATILKQAVNDLHVVIKNWRNKVWDAFQSTVLEKAFAAEQNRLSIQEANLDKTNDIVTRVENLIEKAKANNLDTSALESALDTFNAQIANARSAHATAASIISTHAGFNPNGKVTNVATAKQTVLDARQALKNAANILAQAVKDLKAAVQAWRDAHPMPAPATTAPGL